VVPEALVRAGERLEAFVGARWPGAGWRVEVATTAPCAEGGSWRGVVDLLLLLPDGQAVLVDHKSAPTHPVPAGRLAAAARLHAGQLDAYAASLRAAGLPVLETWIHFPLAGALVRL
jgi:hypothetical protein